MRLTSTAAVAQVMASLWPEAFSNFGVSSSSAACTPMVLKTLTSAAFAKPSWAAKSAAIAALRLTILLMTSLPIMLFRWAN